MVQTENQRKATDFIAFIKQMQALAPVADVKSGILTTSKPGQKITEAQIKEAWDKYGLPFYGVESLQTFGVTMLVLLDQMREVGRKERWLSIGSGPGFYEIFLAKLLPTITIDCVDLSQSMISVCSKFLEANPKQATNITTHQGSINNIPFRDHLFDRVLAINCLHWSERWTRGVDQISRVLSLSDKAEVVIVLAGANYRDGKRVLPIAPNLTLRSLERRLVNLNLQPQKNGYITVDRGQFGQATLRYYSISKRSMRARNDIAESLDYSLESYD